MCCILNVWNLCCWFLHWLAQDVFLVTSIYATNLIRVDSIKYCIKMAFSNLNLVNLLLHVQVHSMVTSVSISTTGGIPLGICILANAEWMWLLKHHVTLLHKHVSWLIKSVMTRVYAIILAICSELQKALARHLWWSLVAQIMRNYPDKIKWCGGKKATPAPLPQHYKLHGIYIFSLIPMCSLFCAIF